MSWQVGTVSDSWNRERGDDRAFRYQRMRNGQIVEFGDSRQVCYHSPLSVVSDSVPCSTTKNTQTKNPYEMVYRKGFFAFLLLMQERINPSPLLPSID